MTQPEQEAREMLARQMGITPDKVWGVFGTNTEYNILQAMIAFAARPTAGIDREIVNAWRSVQQAHTVGDPHGYEHHAARLTAALISPAKTGERGAVIEECARIAEGWPADTADGEYQTDGNSHFWDAGNVYDQARVDAAFRIRALSQPLPDAPIVGGEG